MANLIRRRWYFVEDGVLGSHPADAEPEGWFLQEVRGAYLVVEADTIESVQLGADGNVCVALVPKWEGHVVISS